VTVAALPMYDWPEVVEAADALWIAIRGRLRADGLAAPDTLERVRGLAEVWTDPRLVLGQTCGLPLVGPLAGRVEVVGALDHGLPGCPPGWYRSAVVVRSDDPRARLSDFRGATLAVNATDSQSGWGSIAHHAAPLATAGRFFGAVRTTGAHRASVRAVAAGEADVAAIDAVSWRLARRFERAALQLRTLFLTDPTPGLPLIAARGTDAAALRRAVAAAVAALERTARAELGLRGFVALGAPAWGLVDGRFAAAKTRLRDGEEAVAWGARDRGTS
jgi:ABC-type phosphate/phosphonate transport system substrate-binding protein